MKKTISILVLVFAFTLTTQAQKREGKRDGDNIENMLKKWTKDLSLTEEQQNKIKPLLVEQIEERKNMQNLRKEQQDSGERPTREDREKMRADREAKAAAFTDKLAEFLDKEQLEKYTEIAEKQKNNQRGGRQRRDN
ncbi:hypothetical protein [Polaribacter sargassicola]|uniref:hypothetical protein n=1 Tax=Polaribacter sargassicola TaxID=2836891 RepID=UPI001F3D1B13|nr:hypothetical protein [Polaribacter sp. DS7-9]MCG1036228.1 hypothetical protein [Polaribacter sp. DS7-9]